MSHAGKGPFSPDEQERLGVDIFGNHGTPENDLIACLFDPECAASLADQVGEDTATSTTTTTSSSGTSSKVSTVATDVDEVTSIARRVFFDIPTPEEFLDDFENAFAGFAQSMRDSGLGDTDLKAMLDPSTGFIQSMFSEYMGKVAQRAQQGEELFELVGTEGQPVKVGEREGQVTQVETTRVTRTEAEAILRQNGQEVTESAIQTVIKESGEVSEADRKTITGSSGTTSATEESTVTTTAATKETVTEELFSRPGVARVFKFSPSDFLVEKFDAEDIDDVSVGMLATLIRANAPRRRPQTSAVSTSARRT